MPRSGRASAVAALLLQAACTSERLQDNGAPIPDGALISDARVADDAAALDAPQDAGADAEAERPDAGASLDGGLDDAGRGDSGYGGCSVSGVAGDCVEVAACTGDQVATPGHCPGPSAIQCCTPRGASFDCDPSLMPEPNLGLSEEPGEAGCPAGMLLVPASPGFCVDRFEASLDEVLSTGARPWSPYHHPPASVVVRARSLRGAVPQGYIDGETAARACAEAGKRLCSDAEWLRACRGPSGLIYPYGDTRMPGVCNDARAVHPAVELFPNDPNPFDRIQDACINQLPMSLERTGTRAACASAEGALDMMGNLHEWTADPAGTFRGGFYVDTYRNGEGCLYVTTAHNTLHWDYSTGFRCCATP